jgi:hypothetical protein
MAREQEQQQQQREDNRFRTGDDVETGGTYVFDGYTDGSDEPAPTEEEQAIELDDGGRLPPIRSAKKGAWWRLQDESDQGSENASNEEDEASEDESSE